MNILLVYPKYHDTFWGYKHALKFVSKRAASPPLGLLTVAALLPGNWNKKLVDVNIEKLRTKEIMWADYIFIGAMAIQFDSAVQIIERCKLLGKKIVAGGPLFTEDAEEFENVDHLVLNEAEITLPAFLKDLETGEAKRIYYTNELADMKLSPPPDYSLINFSSYSTKSIQFSRGCPFNCEFCDITALLGHKMRTKTSQQILTELNLLYNWGWRGNIFFADDNIIGNKKILKTDLLPAIIKWMEAHKNPFEFVTEASINLSDDPELMQLMTRAGFSTVFVGIETPHSDSLEECGKVQNRNRDLVESVRNIQKNGMEVLGGFIVGFDSDTPGIFQQQIDFIQKSSIISAMIGLLNAPTKSKLYERLKNEGRILSKISGNNTDATLNFIPKMDRQKLISGYREIIRGIYDAKPFYQRIRHFLKEFQPQVRNKTKLDFNKIMAMVKSIFLIGIFDQTRSYYWQLFFWSLFKRPRLFPLAITYSIYGYHYRRVFKKMDVQLN
ncbi:MAG: B12-binding domain-containing radical SAM protein [Candidatus Hermodarchaeota archaeon]